VAKDLLKPLPGFLRVADEMGPMGTRHELYPKLDYENG